MDNQTKYESNNAIEDILSETLSNSNGNSPRMRIKKVASRERLGQNVNDRMEVSSNKDVNIGLDLLVNKEKQSSNNGRVNNGQGVSNVNSGFNLNSTRNGSDLVNDMLSNLDLDTSSRLSQQDIDKLIDEADQNSKLEQRSILETDLNDNQSHKLNNDDSISVLKSHYSHKRASMTSEETRRKKQEILFKLEKSRRLGIAGIKKFNMSNRLEDMQDELDRVKYERELESSIKFQRKCLMAFVTGSELINNKFDFLDLKLDGWSEQVHDGINDYNEVFEELHEKYSTKMKMAPEIKMLFMLGGSAFMYHLTNSMFKNSIPGMEDIMKQNPDLMKQFASAAINQMQGEERQAAEIFRNFTPAAQPGPQPRSSAPAAFGQGSQNFSAPSPPPREFMNMPSKGSMAGLNQTSGYVETSSALPTSTRITPPVGVDDILNELQSNTDNDVSDILSETSSRKIRIKRKKHKKHKKNLMLNIN